MISGFLRELKRRRVLRTALLYVVGLWIALQAAEVLSEAGLPPSAMRNPLIILSFGLPLALIIGWFFDITMESAGKTGPLGEGVPTEGRFFALFRSDAGVLRQHPRFRKLVVESGLLDYWRKWGWSDYCEPDEESFRCG